MMSIIKNKNTRERLQLILGAIPFLVSGIDSLSLGLYAFGGLNVFVGVINIVAIKFITKFSSRTNTILFLFNSLMAFFASYNYFLVNKKFLPYIWILVGFIYILVAGISFLKFRNERKIARPQ